MQKAHAVEGTNCPLYKEDMSKVCHKCAFWTHVRGAHPQTGEDMDTWNCAIALLPVLMIEVGRQTSHVGAEVNSMRNETAKQAEAARRLLFGNQLTLQLENDVSHSNGRL